MHDEDAARECPYTWKDRLCPPETSFGFSLFKDYCNLLLLSTADDTKLNVDQASASREQNLLNNRATSHQKDAGSSDEEYKDALDEGKNALESANCLDKN